MGNFSWNSNKILKVMLLFFAYTVQPRKFEVLGTRDFISNYQYFELQGVRHKNVTPQNDYYQSSFYQT